MKKRISIVIVVIVVALVGITESLVAGDAYWKAGVSGNWEDTGNWDVVPVANDSIFINGLGNYTSTWSVSSLSTAFSNITVGVSSSGAQTLLFTGAAYQDLSISGDIVVGQNGLAIQDCSMNGVSPSESFSTIQIVNGGLWQAVNTDSRAGFLGTDRVMEIAAGGTFEILEDVICYTKTSGYTNIINGELTGAGTLFVSGGATTRFAGTGVVDVARLVLPSNGQMYFYGGGIVVDSEIYPDNSGYLMFEGPGKMTFNGNVLYTNTPNVVLRANKTDDRTIDGDGDFIISSAKDINILGYAYESAGRLYLTGTGELLMNLKGYTGTFYGSMDLGRASVISNGVLVLSMDKGSCLNVTNELGNILMNDLTVSLPCGNAGYRNPSSLKVSDSGIITFDNVDIQTATHKEKLTLMSIEVSLDSSGGSLDFTSGSENSITLDTSSASSFGAGYWQMRLNANTEVTAAEDASLLLEDGRLLSEISEGWQFEGTLIIGTNMTMTALSQDNGASFNPKEEPNYTGTLKVLEEADVFTLNEFDAGGADTQTCLYVGTLDFSDIQAGSTPVLTGCDGGAKVYYINLINPNNVTFDSTKWVQASESLAGTLILIQ